MNDGRAFIRGLVMTILLTTGACTLLALVWTAVRAHANFLVITLSSMIAFCIILYRLAAASVRQRRAQNFIGIVMAGVFIKMFLCLGLILGYKKLAAPADSTFLWPFLVIYVAFTIFEVTFMDRLGRQKTPLA